MSTISTSPLDAFGYLRRELGLFSASQMKPEEIASKQLHILYHLRLAPATMGELAQLTLSDKASITRTIATLLDAGLVKKTVRPGDKRVTIIELTARGRAKSARAAEVRSLINDRFIGLLTAVELESLTNLMNKVATSLREDREQKERV